MSQQAIATADHNGNAAAIMERVVIAGDLSKLSPAERVNYYSAVCNSLGLNPLTRPFDYLSLNGKLVLYAKKDATDQLRKINRISLSDPHVEQVGDMYVVTITARDAQGRTDTDIGVVNVAGVRGDALANAMMKAITKAKRRVTLSIAGLGWLDETELETIPSARQPATSYVEELDADDARETLPMPEPPRQIAEATVVDGNVVTDDGEIVGDLQPNRPSPELLYGELQRRLRGAHDIEALKPVGEWAARMGLDTDGEAVQAFKERRRELRGAPQQQPELVGVE